MTKQFLLQSVDPSHIDITPQNVKMALLTHSEAVYKPNPLECLSLVDDFLSRQLIPDGPYSRRFALIEILIAIITDQLFSLRQAMEIPPRPPDLTCREAFAAVKRDVQTGNNQLIGWSWLYYGYVRIDLGIIQREFALKTHIEARSLRRYQEAVFLRITDMLIHQESITRRSRTLTSQARFRKDATGVDMAR